MRRATSVSKIQSRLSSYFYPRSPCGERHRAAVMAETRPEISIHALLAESDYSGHVQSALLLDFYPRSPCGERPPLLAPPENNLNFYPRSPCGERPAGSDHRHSTDNFYPRSPCGERRWYACSMAHTANFYPRSPCGERPLQYAQSFTTLKFLSTLSLRRATTDNSTGGDNHYISIHALLAESDGPRCKGPWVCFPFLSTLSLRRATIMEAAKVEYQ